MCEYFAWMYVWVPYVCPVPGEGRRGCLILWNWNFWMVVSHHVNPGNQTQVLWKSRKCSQLLGLLSRWCSMILSVMLSLKLTG